LNLSKPGGESTLFVLLLLFVDVYQKHQLKSLDKEITTKTNTLKSTTDLDKILTIQNQLNTLPTLQSKTPVSSRLLGYVQQITPSGVSISSLNIDYVAQTINIVGSTDSLTTVNKLADTLKFTTYKLSDNTQNNAFSEVVLSSFGTGDKGASYTIDLKFDIALFDASQNVTLVVPGIITTRSEMSKPSALFQVQSNSTTNKNTGDEE
jgi:hypothetical protein